MKKPAIVVVLALAAGCSVSHRSQDYACTTNNDCKDHPNTICQGGFCIAPGSIDAPKAGGDAHPDTPGNTCPAGCTSCNAAQKTCTIDCTQTGVVDCTQMVTCPAGYHCDILCTRDGSCRNGVDCTAGASCAIMCATQNSCENVECGPGPCDVTCSGTSSCQGVSCNNSCACDINCTGSQSCRNIACTSPLCTSGFGCTSVPVGCHSCM
jgi:hypothetical protein